MLEFLIFTVIYTVIDAFNNKFVINKNQNWHTTGFIKRVLVFIYIGYVAFNPIPMIWWADIFALAFIGGSIYWCIFDILLNKLRGLSWSHKGSGIMDKLWILKPFCLFLDFAFIWIFFNR